MRDKQLRRETVKILDEQVKAVAVKRAGEATAKAVEAAELMALWAKIAQEQKEEDAAGAVTESGGEEPAVMRGDDGHVNH